MASLGLLQGLGRGVSQTADMVNRGMQEDRAVSREAEREKMRQASIEKRWKVEDARYADSKAAQKRAEDRQIKQDEKADTRYSEETKYRKDQGEKADTRYSEETKYRKDQGEKADTRYTDSKNMAERQMSLSEQQAKDRKELERKARIEQTLSRFEREAEKEGEAIDRQYARKIDIAKGNGVTGEELKAIYDERDKKHKDIGAKFEGKMIPAIKSFGKDLEGTAYFDYYQQILGEEAATKGDGEGRKFLSDAGVIDASGSLIESKGKVGTGRASAVQSIINADGKPPPTQAGLLAPGLVNGFVSSLAGDNNPEPIDYSQITPIQRLSTATGRAAGLFPGKLLDVAEAANQSAIQPAWTWANTPQKR